MDKKSIVVIVICIALMFVWQGVLVPKYFSEERPIPVANTNAATAASGDTQTVTTATGDTTTVVPATAARSILSTNAVEELLVVTNENARYIFTSRGGGIKEIELVKFPETIARRRKEQANIHQVATLNANADLPVLTILGGAGLIGDGEFQLTQTATGVRAEKQLSDGLRLVKEFEPSTNYLLRATVRWENTASNSITLPMQEWVIGTGTPMGDNDDGNNVGLIWYDGRKSHETLTSYFDNRTLGCFPGTPRSEFHAGNSNVVWAVAHNQFFGALAMPETPALAINARVLTMPRPKEGRFSDPDKPLRKGVETSLSYPPLTLTAGATNEQSVTMFIGPKEYRTLAAIANEYHNDADKVMGFGFFGFFSKALLLIMNWFHLALGIPYGWAIIVLTLSLKVVFWPLTGASTRSAHKMASHAPQLKALKEKYKDDPAKFSQKQMQYFREHKINPVAGCLPMLVQLPVFFGLFVMLRTAIELRGAAFLWVADLSQTDTLFVIPGITFLPFISTHEGLPINPLPLLYIASAIWQTHLTPVSPGMDPAQQKMMRWMPLMFLLFLYNYSSGLALYMTVNNLLTILQTWLLRRHYPVVTAVAAAPTTASVLTPASKKKK
ncbi:MAG: membrane protein insertase YidC [Verrucomicrobiae bacterium]|nr:membrane protein insertase YidC [Verrucomicrobiae bacterium]